MKTSTASAPGKLMLLGDHAVVYGNPCLVTAVDYRVFCDVSISETDEFVFPAGNGNSFVHTALALFRKRYAITYPVCIKTRADYEESYGLGSSSAVTVSLITALSALFDIPLSQQELFAVCYDVVLRVQGVGSGFDIAAAVRGGTLQYVTGGKKIEPLSIDPVNLVVAYSGTKGDTTALIQQVKTLHEKNPGETNRVFAQSAELVERGTQFLIDKNYEAFGTCMNDHHRLLRTLGVSTDVLDNLVTVARDAGAYGAKLSGAGGGDCMIALVSGDAKKPVEAALEHAGGTMLSINTHVQGVRIE